MKPTQPWSMARVASRRQLPKPRKMHGPVGDPVSAREGEADARHGSQHQRIFFAMGECSTCPDCGYHVCSCKPVDPIADGVRNLKSALLAHPDYKIVAYRYSRLSDAYPIAITKTIYTNPHTLKAFTDELERAGVPCHPDYDPFVKNAGQFRFPRPGSVDVAGLEKLRAEWQKDRERVAAEIRKELESRRAKFEP